VSRYALTSRAAEDLDEIWEFVFEDKSPERADAVIERIRESLELVASMPGMGHRRDDLADESLRVWSVYSYLIVNRPEQRPIEIVRIVGGYQDIPHLSAPE
jgi:plasmid stabilization system protein ParE